MNGSRIQRGFRRLGVVLAVPFALGAIAAVVYYPLQPRPEAFWQKDPIVQAAPSKPGLFDDLTPKRTPATKLPPGFELDPPPLNKDPLGWAAILAAFGAAAFGLCALTGWVLAGFARD